METPQPVAIALKQPIETVQELASVLHRKFGENVTLVGKAVTLVAMLAQEFIFVFSEEGSMYVHRTRKMNNALAKAGVALEMRPILRMRYNAWDALSVSETSLRPAAHLAATFDRPTLPASEFSALWRGVVAQQRELCQRLATLKKPLDLMAFLQEREPGGDWDAQIQAYHDAQGKFDWLAGRRRGIAGAGQRALHEVEGTRRHAAKRSDGERQTSSRRRGLDAGAGSDPGGF